MTRGRCTLVGMVLGAAVSVGTVGASTADAVGQQGGGGSSGSGFLVAFGGSDSGRLVAEYQIPITATGELSINFHGDRAAGCEQWGLCAYRGRIALPPARGGSVLVSKFSRHGRTSYRADLVLGTGFNDAGFASHTSRVVSGSVVGLCADEQNYPIFVSSKSQAGRFTLRLLQPDAQDITTRCAGPLEEDVSRASPRATVPVESLLRGGGQIRLAGTRLFSGHGFAGTVSSTIVLRLGAARRQKGIGRGFRKGTKTARIRSITERLRLVRSSGGLTFALQGSANATVCQLLDSCGLHGQISLTPVPTHASAELSASGLASRPRRDLLTALGLARDGNPKGILIVGSVTWKDRGLLTEKVAQSGTCTDSVGLQTGFVSMYPAGSALDTTYVPSTLRTRCPGPMLDSDLASLAGATLTRHRLSRPRFTIELRPGHSLADDGYLVHPSGQLSLTLKRTARTTERVFKVPRSAVSVFTRAPG